MTTQTTHGSRERILDEAARLFAERGYQGLSMREIAEAVGVSKAGLYYHFKDKEALFLAILLSSIENLEQLVAAARAQGGSVRPQLRCLLRDIATHAGDSQAMMRLAEQDAVHLSAEARQAMLNAYHLTFVGQLQALLESAQARGELKPLEPAKLTRLLLGMAYHLLSTPPDEVEGTVDVLLAVFLDGAALS